MKNNTPPIVSIESGKAVAVKSDGFCEIINDCENNISLPFCLPGETVAFEKVQYKKRTNYYFKEIIKPSTERQAHTCKHFTVCGGCVLQHAHKGFYSEFKISLVRNALQQNNLDPYVIQPIKIVPQGQRRRANLEAIKKGEKIFMGFHRLNSHQIVDMQECPVLTEPLQKSLAYLRTAMNEILEPFQKAKIFLLEIDNKVDVGLEIQGHSELNDKQRDILKNIAIDAAWSRLQFRYRKIFDVLHQTSEIVADFHGLQAEVDPWAFLQASSMAEKWMQEIVEEVLKETGPHKRLLDLFSGRGTFTGVMAKFANVDAFEGDHKAITVLQNAAKDLHITAAVQDLFTKPITTKELNIYDAAVIDPPRAGAKAQCEQLTKSSVATIIYISCSPETFAKDAAILENGGYQLEKVFPVDQFLWAAHLEVVGIFKKTHN